MRVDGLGRSTEETFSDFHKDHSKLRKTKLLTQLFRLVIFHSSCASLCLDSF